MTVRWFTLFLRYGSAKSADLPEEFVADVKVGPSDEHLMKLIQNGNKEAFQELYCRYEGFVRSIAWRLGLRAEDVQEIVQEAFIDTYNYKNHFDPSRGSVKTWISRIAYTRSIKFLKRRPREESYDPKVLEMLDYYEVYEGFWIQDYDFSKALRIVLQSLPEKESKALRLYFFEDKLPEKIANEMGEATGNIRNFIYRGLKKLRKQLIQNGLLEGYREFDRQEDKDKLEGL